MNNFFGKQYYGDIPQEKAGGSEKSLTVSPDAESSDWPLWEIFIRSKQGLDHKHVGSLHAADAKMAMENARDVYTRRMEGVSIWVVESKHIHASNPDDAENFYEPAEDKVYRHPTFYDLPDEVKHM
jgi:ring-1,2-phenylacetyl-CoA epoxidase subunit PaaB